jgi:2-dehydropantoate 2-reductase
MKIAIFGAGAIGATLGGRLAEGGADVTLIARGAHLEAMREDGLTIESNGERRTIAVPCTENPAAAGPQDFVILTLKAHTVPDTVGDLRPLLGPETAVVTAMNGIPWWYFHRCGGPFEGHRLDSVDPGGVQWDGIGPERAIGAVVYTAAEMLAPGVVKHVYGNKLPIGEPDGTISARCRALSEALTSAGIEAPVRERIRDEIWLKLWGNLSFNPVSVLTRDTLAAIAADPGTYAVVEAMMVEAQAVGEALGIEFPIDVDARIRMAADVGAHRSSMLQDHLRGRSLEIDPMVTVIQEMGRLVDRPTPTIDMILALVRRRADAVARDD